jgi:hypothetical protein
VRPAAQGCRFPSEAAVARRPRKSRIPPERGSAAVHLLTALERGHDVLWVRWSAVESGPALTHPAVMDQQAEALEQWLDRIRSSDATVRSQAASDLARDRPSAQRGSVSHTGAPAQARAHSGGGGVIRTREGRFRPLTAFEAVPFVHSGTPPPGV